MTIVTSTTAAAGAAPRAGRVGRDVARAVARLIPAGSWTEQGACRTADPEIFYANDAIFAKAVCARCPVVDRCLSWALESREPHGVWGGLDDEERKDLLRPDDSTSTVRRRLALEAAQQQAAANAREIELHRAPEHVDEELKPPASPTRTVPGALAQTRQRSVPAKPNLALAVARAKAGGTPTVVRITPHQPQPGRPVPYRPLTDREIDVLAGLASGKPREKAAADLGISAATFKTHIGRITTKIGSCGSSGHTVALGYAYGYLHPDPLPFDQRPNVGERPLEALCHLAAGRSNIEIAKAMFLAEDTIKTHLRRLMKRFEVGTRAALVDRALHCGLLLAVLDEAQVRR